MALGLGPSSQGQLRGEERGGPSHRSSHSGAGQDVGRSCILVSIAGKNVMLDCGMHMGFSDDVSPSGGRLPPSLLPGMTNMDPGLGVSGSDPQRGARWGTGAGPVCTRSGLPAQVPAGQLTPSLHAPRL